MIAVLDSGGSNLASVLYAIERLGFEGKFTSDSNDLSKATHWILPGVGSAPRAIRKLKENGLDQLIRKTQKPVLGICLGMQILFEHSTEGSVDTLGIFKGTVKKLDAFSIIQAEHTNLKTEHTKFIQKNNLELYAHSAKLRLPHLGWNQVQQKEKHKLFNDIPDEADFYFVHSFAAPVANVSLGLTEYGELFSSVVGRDNFMGVQFHPERSGVFGQQLLKNFITLF